MARKIDILRGVQLDGRVYRAGDAQDAADLEKKLNKKQFKRLSDAGAIGPATSTVSEEDFAEVGSDDEEEAEEEEASSPLPWNFPGKKELEAAGIFNVEHVALMEDSDILDVDGIGPGTLEKIRAFVS